MEKESREPKITLGSIMEQNSTDLDRKRNKRQNLNAKQEDETPCNIQTVTGGCEGLSCHHGIRLNAMGSSHEGEIGNLCLFYIKRDKISLVPNVIGSCHALTLTLTRTWEGIYFSHGLSKAFNDSREKGH